MSSLPSNPIERKRFYNYKSRLSSLQSEVSVITPIYNAGSVFSETITCVLNQSFQNFEWIIINDCSTDENTLTLLKNLENEDNRIRVIHNSINIGPAGSRNNGIKSSTGNYLFFVDADDLLELTVIEKYWLFLQNNQSFTFCNAWHYGFGSQEYIWKKGFELGRNFLNENPIQPTFMARRIVFNYVEFDETIKDGFEDWDFWLRCASAGFWGCTIPELLYWYRRTPNISEKWKNWDMGEKMQRFQNVLKEKYAQKLRYSFPDPKPDEFRRGHLINPKSDRSASLNNLLKDSDKNIFLILPWLSMGGADKFNLDLVKGLTELGWKITIITTQPSENAWMPLFLNYTSDIFALPNYTNPAYFFDYIKYLTKTRKPSSYLISNSEVGYYLAPLLKYSFPDIPLLDYNHMEEEYWNNGGHPQQSVIHTALFERHIVSSQHLKKWMIKRGVKEEKVSTVYTAIDCTQNEPNLSLREKLRTKWGVDEHLCIIAFSGRLVPQKQPEVLIETIRELKKLQDNGFVLAVIGDGPDRILMENLIAKYDLENLIWFMGELSNTETLETLQACDVYFLPSQWEGISLAIYEAMAIALPIVGADVGGQKELVTYNEGYLIKKGTIQEEAKNYATILYSLVIDSAKRKKTGQNAKIRVQSHFQLDRMSVQIENILTDVIDNHKLIAKKEISFSLEQVYSLLFFERTLANKLWADQHKFNTKSTKDIATTSTQTHTIVNEKITWYHENYEPLPSWYKKGGHVLKIIYRKKDWRSIYSNKYKLNPEKASGEQWYREEYDSLPDWYKAIGANLLKKKVK